MAFLPTMSLFLLAAVNNAAEEPVVADTEVANIEEQEEEILDEPAQGAFASCMEGTEWAAADAKNGPLTAKDTCESTFAFEECLTYPADAKKCCPHVCNSEHICAGESFENVSDDVDAASNAVTECLENTYEPSAFAFWRWGATWRRAKYNSCEKVYAAGYTAETDISVALCCPTRLPPLRSQRLRRRLRLRRRSLRECSPRTTSRPRPRARTRLRLRSLRTQYRTMVRNSER